jgi:putative phosphoesterase
MLIGVLSDTHASGIEQLPEKLVESLREVDLIIHLGDFTGKGLLSDLRGLGDFRGVSGNMDSPAVRAVLPEDDVVEVSGKRLGLIHGWGAPGGMNKRIRDRFQGVDAVLYGHTHIAKNEVVNGILFFNPGSAGGKFPALKKTYGIITVEETLRGEIITV